MRTISQNDRKLRNRRKQIDFILQQTVPGDLDDVLEIVRLQADGYTTEDAIRHVANEDDLSDLEREKFAAELSTALALNAELDGASDDLLWKRYEEHFDLIERAIAIGPLKQPIAPADLLTWAKARDIEYPKALDELLSPNDRNAKYQLLEENEALRRKYRN
jgi:hypothetical protein